MINIIHINSLKSFLNDQQLKDLFTLFFSARSSERKHLMDALARSDMQTALIHAHSLKGSTSFLGLIGLYDFCLRLEEKSKDPKTFLFKEQGAEFDKLWDLSWHAVQELNL